MKRVGILTSGGDCQGLNAAIRGVAKGLYQEFGKEVDNFIDEVVESFTQLLAERDDALQQEAQLDQQVKELTNQVAQLKAKNAELQKKLGILAQKIESYREEEDGIKEAILSAQKIGKDAIQEAKDKAAVMLADAEENA